MEDLLFKIYEKVVCYESDSIQLGREFDKQVDEMLEPLKETMTESEIEAVKELIHIASFKAERCGFVLGVRFIVNLLAEIVKPKQ